MGSTELEDQALLQFDRLLRRGELLWSENTARRIYGDPFDFEFRVADSLQSKPIDTEQKKPTDNAFLESDGDWTLGNIGKDHKLILNKFCVVRPQFVLPTLEYQPQSDPLDVADFQAAWDVLIQLPENYMIIFNCGVEAGSSVGHKHLQIIPQPRSNSRNFFVQLREDENEGGTDTVPGAPFKHAAYPLGKVIHGERLEEVYGNLRKMLRMEKDQAHNVLLTRQHLLVIPRTKAWIEMDGCTVIAGNAAGMIGLVYSWSEEQFKAWINYGPMKALAEMGVPKSP
ncbi:putative Ap4A phosphorylase 1/2, ATP adenylyltransferase, HIT-like superfamily [Septoria linicola]|nr:putative Ap4A phosphorylase 1/2, ATP adenylyltransferase, HIT-like superfamily [Septoria linicola]